MRPWMLYLIGGVVALWIAYRVYRIARGWIAERRDRRPPPDLRCPACGANRLDDYSDADSGYCLVCHHVWGVSGRRPH